MKQENQVMAQADIQGSKKVWTDPEVVLLSVNDNTGMAIGINDDWEL